MLKIIYRNQQKDRLSNRIIKPGEFKGIIELNILSLYELMKDDENIDSAGVPGFGPIEYFITRIVNEIERKFDIDSTKAIKSPKLVHRHYALCNYFAKKIVGVRQYNVEPEESSQNAIDFYKSLSGVKKPKYHNLFGNDELRFKEEKSRIYFNTVDYYLDRLIFEIILIAIKNKGFIEIKESLNTANRIGYYYNLYYTFESFDKILTIYDILERLGFKYKTGSFREDVFLVKFINIDENKELKYDAFLQKWIDSVSDQRIYNRKITDILETFSQKNIFKLFKNGNIYISDAMERMYDSDSISVYPSFADSKVHIFRKIFAKNIIPTNLSLGLRYLNRVGKISKWDCIFIVSDYGLNVLEMFRLLGEKEKKELLGKRITLIVSSYVQLEHLKNGAKDLSLDLDVFYLPPQLHNHHMIIFAKLSLENRLTIFDSGLYYYKPGYSNSINALYFDGPKNPKNCKYLFQLFLGLLLRAQLIYSASSGKAQISRISNFNKVGIPFLGKTAVISQLFNRYITRNELFYFDDMSDPQIENISQVYSYYEKLSNSFQGSNGEKYFE